MLPFSLETKLQQQKKSQDVYKRQLMICSLIAIAPKDKPEYYNSMVKNKEEKVSFKTYWEVLKHNRALQMLSLIHILSIMAISVPHILGGTYIVETVFSYPGLGTLAYESARYKDYNLLMVLCILTGIVVVVCNMIAQTINERIDPRIRQ